MSGLLVLLIVLAGLVGYGRMWSRTAKAYAVRATEQRIAEWERDGLSRSVTAEKIAGWRRDNLGEGIAVGMIWPFYLAGRWWLDRAEESLPPTSKELAWREQRIRRLEQELHIGEREI